MNRALLAASRGLEAVNAVASWLHRAGVLPVARADVPVVSVGNITVGGSGKTPLVAALAATLVRLGRRPAILTRGYRRAGRGQVLIAGDRLPPWELVGDEPALLARALPGVPIVVDADRVRGARRAVHDVAATHLVLDDAFQHWRIHRDLDIVAVDSGDPLGRLSVRREHPSALARADAIVVTNADTGTDESTLAALRRHCPEAPVLVCRLRPAAVHRGAERLPVSILVGARVVAFAGIAFPRRFFATVKGLGGMIVESFTFPDHHPFDAVELDRLVAAAEGAEALLLTTAKDAVRLPADLAAKVGWLEVEAVPLDGSFDHLLAPVLRQQAHS